MKKVIRVRGLSLIMRERPLPVYIFVRHDDLVFRHVHSETHKRTSKTFHAVKS